MTGIGVTCDAGVIGTESGNQMHLRQSSEHADSIFMGSRAAPAYDSSSPFSPPLRRGASKRVAPTRSVTRFCAARVDGLCQNADTQNRRTPEELISAVAVRTPPFADPDDWLPGPPPRTPPFARGKGPLRWALLSPCHFIGVVAGADERPAGNVGKTQAAGHPA